MQTVAASPTRLARYTDTTRDARATVRPGRLTATLGALRASPSEGLHCIGPLEHTIERWTRGLAGIDDRPGQVGAALAAADRGTWAGTITAAQHHAVAPLGRRLELLAAGGDLRTIRKFAAGLTMREQQHLAWAFPELIGPLDGLPVTMRYAANAVLVDRAVDEYEQTVRILERAGLPSFLIDDLRPRLDTLRALAQPTTDPVSGRSVPRQLLVFSPDGDGLAAEVFGDLDGAAHIGVFVPGITNTIDNYLSQTAGNSRRIHAATSAAAGGPDQVATIAWLGYDTPGFADAPLTGTARSAAPTLGRMVDALDLAHGATTTVIGHSYGSLVTGHALRDGLDADNIIFAGSPGTGVDQVAAFGSDAKVYALRAPHDPVAMSAWHGADPADPRFGAVTMQTGWTTDGERITGHSAYFDAGSGSLRNIALVISGRGGEVTTVPTGLADDALGWIDRNLGWVPYVGPAVDTADVARDLARDAAVKIDDLWP